MIVVIISSSKRLAWLGRAVREASADLLIVGIQGEPLVSHYLSNAGVLQK